MKPFTLWTCAVRMRRIPLNNDPLVIVLSVTDNIYDAGWVGIQEMTTNCPFFSCELSNRCPDKHKYIKRIQSGYIVT